jgi:hypothetical protein
MAAGTPTGTSGIPVSATYTYTAQALVRSAAVARSVRLLIDWYTAAGASVSTTTGASITSSTSANVLVDHTAVAPATAAFARIRVEVLATAGAAEVHRFDELGFWMGAGGDWAMPGVPITNLGHRVTHPNTDDVLVQRWDAGKSRWQTAHYDSGFRAIATDATYGCVASGNYWGAVNGGALLPSHICIRRVNSTVFVSSYEGPLQPKQDFGSGQFLFRLPVGFRPSGYHQSSMTRYGNNGSDLGQRVAQLLWGAEYADPCYVRALPLLDNNWGNFATGTGWPKLYGGVWITGSFVTSDPIPTSLPGTLISAAPA